MKKLFTQTLDIGDYISNDELEKVATLVEPLSNNAKSAYIPSLEEAVERPDTDFAAVLWHPGMDKMPKYACYNSELTELNLACLASNLDSLPEEVIKVAGANLTAAASKFKLEIPTELKKYASKKFVNRLVDISRINEIDYIKKEASLEKTASHTYALEGKYPLDTKEHMKKASAWFDRNLAKLTVDQTLEFVSNFNKQASALEYMEKTASINIYASLDTDVFNPDLYNHVGMRKSYLKEDGDDYREAYDDCLRRADELGPIKVAYVIEYLDKEAGLNNLYGNPILDPIRTTFGITKIAGMNIDGETISLADIKKIKNEDLTSIVGNDIIKELKGEEGLEILASLPKPIRQEVLALI